jgi:hypothetical protein
MEISRKMKRRKREEKLRLTGIKSEKEKKRELEGD